MLGQRSIKLDLVGSYSIYRLIHMLQGPPLKSLDPTSRQESLPGYSRVPRVLKLPAGNCIIGGRRRRNSSAKHMHSRNQMT